MIIGNPKYLMNKMAILVTSSNKTMYDFLIVTI